MRVVVDGTALCYPLTGIGQYTASLLRAMAAERPAWEFVVLSPYPPSSRVLCPNVRHDLRLSQARSAHAIAWRAWWFDTVLPCAASKVEADLFWAATGLAPFLLSGVPVAFTVYDFVAERFPRTMARLPRLYRRWNQRRWLRRAALVLPISRATADEVRALFGVEAHGVVHPGVDEIFTQHRRESFQASVVPGEGDYLLVLGTLEPRKNLEALFDCVDTLVREHAWPAGLKVVVAGAKGWRDASLMAKMRPLETLGVLQTLGYVPRDVLPPLLAGARVLLMPSLYEGFGMPIAEAMAVGCPVMCSDIPPFREVIGAQSAYWHGANKKAMLDAYRLLVANLPCAGSAEPTVRFTWGTSAKVFVSAVERLGAHPPAACRPCQPKDP